ncbi:type II toxin-antitoxin system RelE/ParE family toxin [Aquabacterium sp.]|uniref:type II toxin-antitoxin system RelE/ParE family toxin n=1 Tax=Aquabacterium sp. TaxID=1872578 RepID=UPI002BE36846|nr:type II toxin-antitoxin system RelE/ParE family toxin [Aquabacterium sp.]HSW07186.1 type II toxin-antitoxin system RelE/ParE family toxin [Aquabacterium sp.]
MKLRWSRRALADLRRLTDKIAADDKPLAAQAFTDALVDKLSRLEEFPLLGRAGAYEDTRELIVHRNYLVTYRLRADEIQLLQIWHVARERRR